MKNKLFFVTLILILVLGFSSKPAVAQNLRFDLGLTAPFGFLAFNTSGVNAEFLSPFLLFDSALTFFIMDNNISEEEDTTNEEDEGDIVEKYFNVGPGLRFISLGGLFSILYPQAVLEWRIDRVLINLNIGGGVFVGFTLLQYYLSSGVISGILPGVIIDFNVNYLINHFFKLGGGIVSIVSTMNPQDFESDEFSLPFILKGNIIFYF